MSKWILGLDNYMYIAPSLIGDIMEKWVTVPGFEYYEVSNFGRIRSIDRIQQCLANGKYPCLKKIKGKILKPRISQNRNQVAFCVDGTREDYWVHRIVAMAFLQNPFNLSDVNHIDGNPSNNHVDNLEWCTRSHNMQHAHNMGLIKSPKGEKSHMSVLSEKQVIEIRQKRKNGVTATKIANEYGVRQQTVSEICLRHTWKHI